jgi:radical SAM superfamily enzyme YgiQ (UPF0313 family)
MRIVLWDTRQRHVTKDFAGGFGMGAYHGKGGVRGKLIRRWYTRDQRPTALTFAYMAGVFKRLGHAVEYAEDGFPAGADVYVFNPSLPTLDLELEAIRTVRREQPSARVLILGAVAYAMPGTFADLGVVVVRGEPEQLLWKLDEALACEAGVVNVGSVADLDALPFPDWTPFPHRRFRINYDFTRFPTGLVQQSRGCAYTCNYCPYILIENKTRFRSPELIEQEIVEGTARFGFRSFKFRDPLFGLNRRRMLDLAERLSRLPKKIQFSIETRIDLVCGESLRALRDAGLTSITVGIETPSETTLKQYLRKPIADDRQRQFIETCRGLGIRIAAGFMIGFPEDTPESIRKVLDYAKGLNPTFANFNIVTPYPSTAFFAESSANVSDVPWQHYDMYTPVMNYDNLTREQVHDLHAKCFTSYYSRWPYLTANAHLLWPALRKLGAGRRFRRFADDPRRALPATRRGAAAGSELTVVNRAA